MKAFRLVERHGEALFVRAWVTSAEEAHSLIAAILDAQGMARDSAETEGLRSLRTAKPGPKDVPQ